jgi:putative peptide zinc metalloprotease protein
MDLLRLPNLYTRALAYVQYLFMNQVLGISLVPNPATTPREVILFTIYGISAFCYRIFLYLAISMGVYYRFDKLLGIILAVVAFTLFVIRPLVKGAKTVFMQRKEIHPRLVGVSVFAGLLLVALVVLITPVSRSSIYPCYMDSAKVQKLTVPLQTSVAEVFIREGTPAAKGDLLFTLEASLLKLNLVEKEVQREILRNEVKNFQLDEKRMASVPGKEIELRKVADQAERIRRDLFLAEAGIVAPFDGVVTSLDYKLQTGFGPGEGVVVGEFESLTDCVVHALIPARDLYQMTSIREAKIWFLVGTGITLTGRIDEIKPYSEQNLKNLPFSSRLGGELATETRGEDLTDAPLEAFYLCSVNLKNPQGLIPLGMTGKFILHLPARSILSRVVETAFTAFNKELIF